MNSSRVNAARPASSCVRPAPRNLACSRDRARWQRRYDSGHCNSTASFERVPAGTALEHEPARGRSSARPSAGVGRQTDLRLSRAMESTAAGRARPGGRATRVDPGAPRGDGRVHGVRPREVHGRSWRLHGDLRARARSTCSTGSTTRSSTTSRSWRSSVKVRARSAAISAGGRPANLFKDVASDYVQMATHPAQIRHPSSTARCGSRSTGGR